MRTGVLARRLLPALMALVLLVVPVRATWSIVAVNTHTGEVVVAAATCLNGFPLKRFLPVIVVGRGAAAAQASIDVPAINRPLIFANLQSGLTPAQILQILETQGSNHQARQYGIASFDGLPVTFSGANNAQAALGVTGFVDGIAYAIQGNILTGAPVVHDAELALRATPGDLSQKVMAAMEAARAMGGDGRCSCTTGPPTSCGTPPPGFVKSAHVAFFVLARPGDADGVCDLIEGCASGTYYLCLDVTDGLMAPDPILTLRTEYDAWRTALIGRPDHVLSRVVAGATSLPADGVTATEVTVRLLDVDGHPLITGGAAVSVARAGGGAPFATPGAVTDHGDGSYSFPLAAGTQAGTDSFVVTVDDGVSPVTLHPPLEVATVAVQPLHAGSASVSALSGGEVAFVVNEPAAALGGYVLLGTASGTSPGVSVGPVTLPLNPDRVFVATVNLANTALLPGSAGLLDNNGRAQACFAPPPGLLTGLIGARLDWAVLHVSPALGVTNTVGFDVLF